MTQSRTLTSSLVCLAWREGRVAVQPHRRPLQEHHQRRGAVSRAERANERRRNQVRTCCTGWLAVWLFLRVCLKRSAPMPRAASTARLRSCAFTKPSAAASRDWMWTLAWWTSLQGGHTCRWVCNAVAGCCVRLPQPVTVTLVALAAQVTLWLLPTTRLGLRAQCSHTRFQASLLGRQAACCSCSSTTRS